MAQVRTVVRTVNDRLAHYLSLYSISVLRVSLGLVFLGFGVLKFFPGASPAAELAERTIATLSFGLVSDGAALLITALTETFIGAALITGRLLKSALLVLAVAMLGILSPAVLFFSDLFPGAPTLEGQYVLKDIVLAAAALVVAARAQGARLVQAPQR